MKTRRNDRGRQSNHAYISSYGQETAGEDESTSWVCAQSRHLRMTFACQRAIFTLPCVTDSYSRLKRPRHVARHTAHLSGKRTSVPVAA